MATPEEISKPFLRTLTSNQREYVVKDLSKLSQAQLLELRDRQVDILKNKSRLAKLPDKGKRIQDFHDKIVKELENKDEIDKAAELFSVLNISSKGTKFVTNLEWTGDLHSRLDEDNIQVDVEDETDPLKILAQSRAQQKIVKVEKPEETLITPEDLKDIELIRNLTRSNGLDEHATYLCGKEDLPSCARIKFRPYQTTKTNVHDPEKETHKIFKYLEITAATPPHLRHPGTKMLTLHESLDLQIAKDKELKETQQKDAEARLAEKSKQVKARDFVAKDMGEFFKTYRVANESSDESDESSDEEWDSAEEVLDIDAQEMETGGVNYTYEK